MGKLSFNLQASDSILSKELHMVVNWIKSKITEKHFPLLSHRNISAQLKIVEKCFWQRRGNDVWAKRRRRQQHQMKQCCCRKFSGHVYSVICVDWVFCWGWIRQMLSLCAVEWVFVWSKFLVCYRNEQIYREKAQVKVHEQYDQMPKLFGHLQ